MFRRELTPLEERVRQYIAQHPGRTPEDIYLAFSEYNRSLMTYAVRHLISDAWVDENTANNSLTVRDEPRTSLEAS